MISCTSNCRPTCTSKRARNEKTSRQGELTKQVFQHLPDKKKSIKDLLHKGSQCTQGRVQMKSNLTYAPILALYDVYANAQTKLAPAASSLGLLHSSLCSAELSGFWIRWIRYLWIRWIRCLAHDVTYCDNLAFLHTNEVSR